MFENQKNFLKATRIAEYRNYPVQILRASRNLLSRSAQVLWEYLYEASTFTNFSLMTSLAIIAANVKRSQRTVSRLLSELQTKTFILKKRIQNKLNIIIGAPTGLVNEILKKPRVFYLSKSTSVKKLDAKNGVSLPSTPYYNNINNNKTASVDKSTDDIIYSKKSDEDKRDRLKDDHNVYRLKEKIIEIDRQSDELSHELKIESPLDITQKPEGESLMGFLIRNKMTDKAKSILNKINELDINRNIIHNEISRIENHWNRKAVIASYETKFIDKQGNRLLTPRDKKRLQKLDNPMLRDEIAYAVRFGALADKGKNLSTAHALSISLKLVAQGRWKTPRGMHGAVH